MKQLILFLMISFLYWGCSDDPAGSNGSDSNTFASFNFEQSDTYFSFAEGSGDSIEPAQWDIKFSNIPFLAYEGCQLVMTIADPVIFLGEGVTAARVDALGLEDVTTIPDAGLFKADVEKEAVIGGNYLDASFNYTNDVFAVKTCAENFALVQIDNMNYNPVVHQVYDIRMIVKYNEDGTSDFSATQVDTLIVPNAYTTAQYCSFLDKGMVGENDPSDLKVEGYKFYLGDGVYAKNLNVQDISAVTTVSDDGWNLDAPGAVTYDWYTYNPSTHSVTPKDYIYVVKTADGKYYALEVLSIYNDMGDYGFFDITWKEIE